VKVQINGKPDEVPEGLTIMGLLGHRGVESPNTVSVELNGQILKRANFETTNLSDGDVVEFLYFLGGGSRP
jgi:sulfur carrier protein